MGNLPKTYRYSLLVESSPVAVTESSGPEVGKEEDVKKGSRSWAETAKGGWPATPGEGEKLE